MENEKNKMINLKSVDIDYFRKDLGLEKIIDTWFTCCVKTKPRFYQSMNDERGKNATDDCGSKRYDSIRWGWHI